MREAFVSAAVRQLRRYSTSRDQRVAETRMGMWVREGVYLGKEEDSRRAYIGPTLSRTQSLWRMDLFRLSAIWILFRLSAIWILFRFYTHSLCATGGFLGVNMIYRSRRCVFQLVTGLAASGRDWLPFDPERTHRTNLTRRQKLCERLN